MSVFTCVNWNCFGKSCHANKALFWMEFEGGGQRVSEGEGGSEGENEGWKLVLHIALGLRFCLFVEQFNLIESLSAVSEAGIWVWAQYTDRVTLQTLSVEECRTASSPSTAIQKHTVLNILTAQNPWSLVLFLSVLHVSSCLAHSSHHPELKPHRCDTV